MSIVLSGSLILTGSISASGNLTTLGTITAQTLVVQTITSSIVNMTGSNIFGSQLTDRQTFTGSVVMTGSLTVNTTGTEFQVTNAGVVMGNLLTDNHSATGSFRVTGSILQNGGALAPQDGTVLYFSSSWFVPTSTVSTSGTTVTSVGTQFTSAMVGAKLTILGESRIISAFTSTTQVTVDSAYSQNYSGIAAGSWGVFSRAFATADRTTPTDTNVFYDTGGNKKSYFDQNGNLVLTSNYVIANNTLSAGTFFSFGTAAGMRFSSANNDSLTDVRLRRISSGSLQIDNASSDTEFRDLILRNITGSNAFFSGSLAVSGSSSITGSLNVSRGITGSLFGTASQALTASFLLGGGGSGVGFPFTGSAQITGSLGVTGSITSTGNITTTGTLTAQTLVVQTVTSSIVFSSGSNRFGSQLTDRQTFTGSVVMTGSLTVNTTGTEFQVTNNGVVIGNLLTDNHSMTGSVLITGSLTVNTTGTEFQVTNNGVVIGNLLTDRHSVTGSLRVTGSGIFTNTVIVSGSLTVSSSATAISVQGSGSSVFSVDGTVGRLFEVDDSLSGSLFSVNTAAGLPVIEAFSDNTVRIGQFGQRALFVSQSRVGIGMETPTANLHISGSGSDSLMRISSIVSSSIFFVSGSGNVGIGTITPQRLLHLTGSGDTYIRVDRGSIQSLFGTDDIGTYIGQQGAFDLRLITNAAERFRITSVGNVGIGTSTVTEGTQAVSSISIFPSSSVSNGPLIQFPGNGRIRPASTGDRLSIDGNALFLNGTFGANIVMATGGGNVGIGTTSPSATLEIAKANSGGIGPYLFLRNNTSTATNNAVQISFAGNSGGDATAPTAAIRVTEASNAAATMTFHTYDGATFTERMRITSAGNVLIGKTNDADAGQGVRLLASGLVQATRDQADPLSVNRTTNDGTLVSLRQDGTEEGTISVSGTTVSYNSFLGSHWSQLQDGSKIEILKGTIIETIDEMCIWEGEKNDRLPKSKISDTVESKNVYGTFLAWDEDWQTSNDFYVAAVGLGYIRVNSSQNVSMGDLLQSNGDGTAKIQEDDTMRSSTIAKVVSTNKIETYEDGSYLIAATLHCG
jgi:hypothetical protein